MKIYSFILILIFLSLLPSISLSQKNNLILHNEIEEAEMLIEAGKSNRATLLLNRVFKEGVDDKDVFKAKILSARILQENGQRIKAIGQLQDLLASHFISKGKNITLRADTYLVLSECYFGMYWFEKFKSISDTLLQLSRENQLPLQYLARAYTNLARYFAYQTMVEKSKLLLDSALKLLKNAALRDQKKYCPISILTATINIYRNYNGGKLNNNIDSAIVVLSRGYPYEKFNQVYLLRAIGNAYFDKSRAQDKRLNWRYYGKAASAFEKASQILNQNYPTNKIDHVSLNNLHGLLDYYIGFFGRAEKYFAASKQILTQYNFSPILFTYSYLNTYLWWLGNSDSLYRDDELFEIKKKELSEWQSFTPNWELWEEANRQAGLPYYRDMYSVNPYNIIVHLCYQLYQYQKENKYLDIALAAQENSKCYFLKNRMMTTYGLSNPVVPTVSYVQQLLQQNEALISYSDVESYLHSTYAVIVTKDTASIVKIDIEKIFNLVGHIRNSDSVCKNIGIYKKAYYGVYEGLFKPMKYYLSKRITNLLILPSTRSSFFNFGMMISDTLGLNSFESLPYLNTKYNINYEFSWQVSALRKQGIKNRQKNPKNIQAYVPDYYNSNFYQLPFFRRSVTGLKNKFNFTTFSEGTATISLYGSNAGQASILHLAGHCISNVDYSGDMAIVMDSSKTEEQKYLSVEKIIQTNLKADLTVLSLCETGIGESHVSGSYLDMAYWFTYAGSKSCLYSYWKLDDRSTAFILERFYHYLAMGIKKSAALQNAKSDYLEQAKTEEEKNPVYWGGLTLIGDDDPISITENKKITYWYFFLLLLIPPIFYLMKRVK